MSAQERSVAYALRRLIDEAERDMSELLDDGATIDATIIPTNGAGFYMLYRPRKEDEGMSYSEVTIVECNMESEPPEARTVAIMGKAPMRELEAFIKEEQA